MTYRKLIAEAVGNDVDPATIERIEDTMRNDIFHSTLDWQTREQLIAAARQAYGLIRVRERGASRILTPADTVTAALLNLKPADIPALAQYAKSLAQ